MAERISRAEVARRIGVTPATLLRYAAAVLAAGFPLVALLRLARVYAERRGVTGSRIPVPTLDP